MAVVGQIKHEICYIFYSILFPTLSFFHDEREYNHGSLGFRVSLEAAHQYFHDFFFFLLFTWSRNIFVTLNQCIRMRNNFLKSQGTGMLTLPGNSSVHLQELAAVDDLGYQTWPEPESAGGLHCLTACPVQADLFQTDAQMINAQHKNQIRAAK